MEESRAQKSVLSRRLRVVMVIQRFRPQFSGQGVQVEELSKMLARRGVDVTVATAARDKDSLLEEHMDGYRIHRVRCELPGSDSSAIRRRLWPPVFALQTAAYLWKRRREIDLVHVHGVNDALYASWAIGRLCTLPVLFEMTLMGADDPETVRRSRNLFSGLRYAVYRRCDGYVAISPTLARAYLEAGLPAERLVTIPQGVDLDRYAPVDDRGNPRASLGLPLEGPLLVFLGSLVERKGIDVLLAAWERIHAAEPRAHLVLVGRDRFPEDAAAQEFFERYWTSLPATAAANVRRVGVRDDAQRFLQAADVFLFPSRREGFGTAIIEAMACGLPCVVAELSGITDFIFVSAARSASAVSDRVPDGIVIPQDSPAALAEAALHLLAASEHAAKIGLAARTRARERFGLDRIADEYLACYGNLLHVPGESEAP